jgi:hypothetical protein
MKPFLSRHRKPPPVNVPSSDVIAELTRLADGTLDEQRAAALRERVRTDPALARELVGQERAVVALRSLDVQAPAALRASVGAASVRPPRRLRLLQAPRAVGVAARAGAALTVAVASLLVALLAAGGGPSVAQAATLALRPPTLAAPAENPHHPGSLRAAVDGVAFPYWDDIAWRAVGARSGRISGRAAFAVRYLDSRGDPVGYAIVSGKALGVSGGRLVHDHGVTLHVLSDHGRTIVTWPRGGHSCVLAATGVPAQVLLNLAEVDLR